MFYKIAYFHSEAYDFESPGYLIFFPIIKHEGFQRLDLLEN